MRRGAASPRATARARRADFSVALSRFSLTPHATRLRVSSTRYPKRSANPFFRSLPPMGGASSALERPGNRVQRCVCSARSEVAEDRCSVASPANARRDDRRQRRAGGGHPHPRRRGRRHRRGVGGDGGRAPAPRMGDPDAAVRGRRPARELAEWRLVGVARRPHRAPQAGGRGDPEHGLLARARLRGAQAPPRPLRARARGAPAGAAPRRPGMARHRRYGRPMVFSAPCARCRRSAGSRTAT
jgi:hypothetical protein